jgi:hypothetical protein
MKNIVINYPKQYKVLNAGKDFHKLMVEALKQKVTDRMHRPKGTEAQREATPAT